MATAASRTIKSAHRVLEIIEYFDQDRRQATVMDMSRTLNYPQSSMSELLRCLTRLGYLHYNRVRRTYSPTTRVALLGAWVKPSLFRGGPLLSAIDDLARQTEETVMLSTACNYEVQHLHVIHGKTDRSFAAHIGDILPLLHTAQGKLLLASYQNVHIRSTVHRLNAEEADVSGHVRIAELLPKITALRETGWSIDAGQDGFGCVAVLLPWRRHMDRLVISVQAATDVIAAQGQDLLQMLLSCRDKIAECYTQETGEDAPPTNVVPLHEPMKIANHRRYFA